MKLRRFCISLVSLTLVFFLSVFIFFPLPGYIPVLMYHFIYPKEEVSVKDSLNVSIDAFERQMWFLKTFGYRVISMDEYYEIKMGSRKPRGKEILITFDDGHRTYIKNALPILKRYQLKSTEFLIWRYLSSSEWKDYINLNEAKELSGDPLITFESHTMTHPNLTQIPSSRAKSEIFQSKEYLQKALKKEMNYFSYPEGSFSPEIMQFVQKAGYRMAFRTSFKKYKTFPQIPYAVVRIKVSPKYNLFVFWLEVSGLAYYAKHMGYFFDQLTPGFHNDKLKAYTNHHGAA